MKRSTIQKADRINAVARELTELKKQIEADRIASIKEKLEINSRAVETQNSHLLRLAQSRRDGSKTDQTKNKTKINLDNEVCIYEGSDLGFPDKDITNFQEEFPSAGIMVSHSRNKKSTIKFAKLPFVEQIPRYTTWIFSSRNQMMAEGQSAFNQRQIYYDPSDKETLICSDSEEEIPETEREKIFSEGEDLMLWEIIKKHGLTDDVLDQLCQFIDASSSKIRERYENLLEKPKPLELTAPFSYESLAAAMDSFDAIFCRRCLVFFCNLHECPSALIIPSVKLSSSIPDAGSGPCENLCYMKDAIESQAEAEALTFSNNTMTDKSGKRKAVEEHEMGPSEIPAGEFGVCYQKRKKRVPISDAVSLINEEIRSMSLDGAIKMDLDARERGGSFAMNDNPHLNRCSKEQKSQAWSTMEKDLYSMGVEIFGKDSCFITRNLLSGLKTCEEVRNYMIDCDSVVTDDKSLRAENIGVDANQKEEEKRRTQILRRRGRSRKLRYTWKSASHPYIRKRVINGKSDVNIRYTPCACQPICGKQCPCRLNSTFCQKYCGCFNRCKYHFKGCHCGKSQCRTRQCPCFASNRECDPDICKYCWISCGDGSLGEPPARGESLGCGNMKLLLKQKQRILIAKSDVAGWGAFTQNALNKDDYLGEYTGELISHREADKRGKIYDRANSSYLFDLNDEYVLDAFRKGDKLKFANHSSNPNCYAKVMLVGSEHKVGIYAKERIEAGDELFYDYGYGPNIAPSWARKSEDSNIDEAVAPIARAKKIA